MNGNGQVNTKSQGTFILKNGAHYSEVHSVLIVYKYAKSKCWAHKSGTLYGCSNPGIPESF
jgi:hypothetical protein